MANATIKTIAEEAKVSIATVSKALNDMPDVSEAVKVRIREIARRQGYTINKNARQLASGHADSVGVILPDITERNMALLYKSLAARLNKAGYSVYLSDSEGSAQNEAQLVLEMLEKRVGVLLIMAATSETRHIEDVVRGQVPVVYLGGAVNPNVENAVICDDYKGGMLAARHLYHNGCRNSVVFTWGNAATPQHERARGFIAYMQEHRAVVRSMHAGPAGTEAAAEALVAQLLESRALPSAIFATNDLLAVGAIHALRRWDIRVPQDISVIGYGDSPGAGFSLVQLTSVALPSYEMGICACDLALGLLRKNGDVVRKLTLEPQLVRRGTVHLVR